ncbi:MAG: ATP-binding protein, partial [Ignavibacteriales bacterium]|nr:ATP-binding protein [Ignavibacteriales bacterium]
ARYEDLPVIMQTGMDDPDTIRQGIIDGALYFLTKPFSKEVLQMVVSAVVSNWSGHRDLLHRLESSAAQKLKLEEGRHTFRTIEEAESLAVKIASLAKQPSRALRISELLINAVEHGNLGITYEEKGELMRKNRWRDEVDRRLNLPAYRGIEATITVRLDPKELRVDILDGGKGFDFKQYLVINPTRVFDSHGRGIALANSFLHLRFHPPGNRVTVTFSHNPLST